MQVNKLPTLTRTNANTNAGQREVLRSKVKTPPTEPGLLLPVKLRRLESSYSTFEPDYSILSQLPEEGMPESAESTAEDMKLDNTHIHDMHLIHAKQADKLLPKDYARISIPELRAKVGALNNLGTTAFPTHGVFLRYAVNVFVPETRQYLPDSRKIVSASCYAMDIDSRNGVPGTRLKFKAYKGEMLWNIFVPLTTSEANGDVQNYRFYVARN